MEAPFYYRAACTVGEKPCHAATNAFPVTDLHSFFLCFLFCRLDLCLSGAIALSDSFTTSVTTKMRWCVGTTSIAQFALALIYSVYLARLDWGAAARVIHARAHTDRPTGPARERELSGMEDGCGAASETNDQTASNASASTTATEAAEP